MRAVEHHIQDACEIYAVAALQQLAWEDGRGSRGAYEVTFDEFHEYLSERRLSETELREGAYSEYMSSVERHVPAFYDRFTRLHPSGDLDFNETSSPMAPPGRLSRRILIPLVAAVLLALSASLMPTPAHATVDTQVACPSSGVPRSGASAGVHTPSVDCLEWYGIRIYPTASFDAGRFATRGEIAAFLAGVIDASERAGAGSSAHSFTDIRGHRHERAIARLSNLGVIHGYDARTFGPDDRVTRAQMAALLMRAGVQVHDLSLQPLSGRFPFADVPSGNVHHDNISRLARSRITEGVTADRYDPGGHVSRGQAASFTVRMFALIVADGGAAAKTPEPGRWRNLATSADPGFNQTTAAGGRHRAALTSFDYAGNPMCTEYARAVAIMVFVGDLGVAHNGLAKLSFSSREGQPACVWTAPEGNAGAPTLTTYRKPASAWRAAPSGCFTPTGLGVGFYADVTNVWFCERGPSGEMQLEARIGQHVYVSTSRDGTYRATPPLPGTPHGFWEMYFLSADTARILEGLPTNIPGLDS